MATHRIVSIACWVILTLSTAAAAQNAVSQAPEAALESIDRTLKEIVDLLRVQVGNQRTELAVRRLDIASREIAVRGRELHDAERERDSYARNQKELTARSEMYGDARPEDDGMTDAQYEYMLKQFESQTETAKQNLFRADQRIIDLRQEITRAREDLLTWEAIVAASFVEE